jgi:hypothetical protein
MAGWEGELSIWDHVGIVALFATVEIVIAAVLAFVGVVASSALYYLELTSAL